MNRDVRECALNVEGDQGDVAVHQRLAVDEQPVELGAVAGEAGAPVEDLAEHVLHRDDVRPDGELPAELLLQVGSGGKVVGMGVRLEQPLDLQDLPPGERDDVVGGPGAGAARGVVEIEDAVDDRGDPRLGVMTT